MKIVSKTFYLDKLLTYRVHSILKLKRHVVSIFTALKLKILIFLQQHGT